MTCGFGAPNGTMLEPTVPLVVAEPGVFGFVPTVIGVVVGVVLIGVGRVWFSNPGTGEVGVGTPGACDPIVGVDGDGVT